MNIVVGSAFRNSAFGLSQYMNRVKALQHALAGHSLRVIAAEGDSRDKTREALTLCGERFGLDVEIADCTHGGPVYGSTEAPERLAALTVVGNAIFSHVRETDDVLVYVESDLFWDAATIHALIKLVHERSDGFDVIAPLIFAGPHFYDVFCYRKNGARFAPFAPYHSELRPTGITEVDSVGSCLVVRGEVARQTRIPHGEVLIGWCAQARANGYRVGVHAELKVYHLA